jgi:agmatinase
MTPLQQTTTPIRPFLDWPVVTDPARWGGKAAVIGIPYSDPYPGDPVPNDQTTAPDAIRAQSHQFWDGADRFDFDLGATLGEIATEGMFDAGNCVPPGADFARYFDTTVAQMRRLFETTRMVCVLGGDHGITIPVLRAMEVLGRPVHVVQIDAHLDWRDDVGGVRLGYSSPLRRASELPFVSGITQVGLRGTGSARAQEHRDACAWGARLFTAEDVHADGLGPILRHLDGKGPYYLTIDADGLDPSVMPGVMGPVPGGLRAEQVLTLLRWLAREGLVGMDVVEVAPAFDLANRITAITAGRLIVNAVGHELKHEAGRPDP